VQVLDLFCGMGGLSSGFTAKGFSVTGVDISKVAGDTYELNGFGRFRRKDLSKSTVRGDYPILLGGPPCRPWSSVNTVRREKVHRDYKLLGVYFKHLLRLKPKVFVLENVPAVKNSGTFDWWAKKAENEGYDILRTIVRYSDFGAATRRRRFIAIGVMGGDKETTEKTLNRRKKDSETVKSKIWDLRNEPSNAAIYHEWPTLKTIDKYRDLYETGKYGWYKLRWDEPAPSFGNVMKTYILHPMSFDGGDTRVISVREALLVMGFKENFAFANGAGLGAKYQMVADSVSPVFSEALASTVEALL
jgi:DNA (cytosine-5)-methyltransferase 1